MLILELVLPFLFFPIFLLLLLVIATVVTVITVFVVGSWGFVVKVAASCFELETGSGMS